MYIIEITPKAEDFIKKLPKNDSEVILRKIYSIRENPFSYLKKLKGSKLWRLRIMDYRAIVDVVVSGKRIYVLRISHRKNIYD